MMSLDRKDQKIISKTSVENYSEGLRILAVDDNPVCLKLLSVVLQKCGYQFTATTETGEAYDILKKNKNNYDLVLTDVKNNMDGFKFAQFIDLEMDIPVIIMSADDKIEAVMNGIKHGARNYLLKPIRYEEIKIIWQHVARKNRSRIEKTSLGKRKDPSPISLTQQMDYINDQEDEIKAQVIKENKKSHLNKQRYRWTYEIDLKFIKAVEQLGLENATPTKILALMKEQTVTRAIVASHLQKYRFNCLKKKENAKRMEKEYEKAMTSLHCSSSLPCRMNEGIKGLNYQNRSMNPIVTPANLNYFGENVRKNCNTVNSHARTPQNHLQFSLIDDQMSRIIGNNPVMGTSASSNSDQHFKPEQEADGIKFNSLYSRPIKTENNYLWGNSFSSGGYNRTMAQPTNSLLMLPPNSSDGPIQVQSTQMTHPANSIPMPLPSSSCCMSSQSQNGQIHMPDTTHSTQMAQPVNPLPMLSSSSSYGMSTHSRNGEIDILDTTHSIQMAQPINSLPMLSSSSSYGRIQMADETHSIQPINSVPMLTPTSSFGQLERGNLSREQSLDNYIRDLLDNDFTMDFGGDDPLGAMFNDNSATSL